MAQRERAIKRVTQAMIECARLTATGEYKIKDLAEKYGKHPTTIQRWLLNPAVQEEYREILKASEAGIVAKARRVLERSMDSKAGDGYIAFQASQEALRRYEPAVMGEDKQEVVLKIVGYTPTPGMPERTEEEE